MQNRARIFLAAAFCVFAVFGVSGTARDSILKIANRAVHFVLFMPPVVLLTAYIPAVSTNLRPVIYK